MFNYLCFLLFTLILKVLLFQLINAIQIQKKVSQSITKNIFLAGFLIYVKRLDDVEEEVIKVNIFIYNKKIR